MVYEKSSLGYSEFIGNNRTLHFKERQVLLLISGTRTIEDLEQIFKKDQLTETIQKLELNGYITKIEGPSKQLTPPKDTNSIQIINSYNEHIASEKMQEIKTILIEATDDYLGLMGRSIRTRIEASHNQTDLRASIASWHMAMRESKLGRESASFLIEQIHKILENATSTAPRV